MNSEWKILQNKTARIFPSLTRRSNISSVTSSISSFSNCDSNHSRISSSFSTSPTIVQFYISFNFQPRIQSFLFRSCRFAQLLHPPTHHRKDLGFVSRNTRSPVPSRFQSPSQLSRRRFSQIVSRACRNRRQSSPARSALASNPRHRGCLK